MFVGHYTPSLGLARAEPVPLWVLFLAAQFWTFAFAMLAVQGSSFVLPLPDTPAAFATMSLANYIGLAAVAAVLERRWG